MGAAKHAGRVDSCFPSPKTLKRRVTMKPSTSAAWALVEVGVTDAGRPREECLLNKLHMGVNLRRRGSGRDAAAVGCIRRHNLRVCVSDDTTWREEC